jgi:hypothetical protein
MDLKLYEDYIYTRKLDLDTEQQRKNAHSIHDHLVDKYFDHPPTYNGGSSVTKYYGYYNYLTYAFPEMQKLFTNIRETFNAANNHAWNGNPPDNEYYIQCWLNYYEKGEFIDWHGHLLPEARGWHGFYCVDVEPNSSTTYKLNGKQIEIKSEDNLIVIGKSIDDLHRSSEWLENKPRITIAFDISPIKNFDGLDECKNEMGKIFHWIPL